MTQESPVALITGAAQRLGAATAETLHQRGYRILIHYRHSTDKAQALADHLNAHRSDSAATCQADLEKAEQVQALAQAAVSRWQRLDLLVNNASVFYPTPLETASIDDWERITQTNLHAPFLLIQQCLPALKAARGSVVNLIDIYAERPLGQHPLYCASKAGLAMLTKSLARDLAPDIRVNGVSPGAILWPENGETIDPDYQQRILSQTPLARTGQPSDIAGAIAWLACDAPFVTGQIIAVDGGRTLNQ